MRIICPTCSSHYEVDAEKIGAAGQLVRCAQCRDVWLVHRPDVDAVPIFLAPLEEAPSRLEQEARPSPRPDPDLDPSREPIDFGRARARLHNRPVRLGRRGDARWTLGGVAVVALVLAAAMGVIGGRTAIVRRLPAAAALYATIGLPVNTGGLALRGVRSALVTEGDRTVLALQGEIANLGNDSVPVPQLTMVVRDAGQSPLYTWTAASPKARLAKGESVTFRSRLAAPPSAGQDVRVSFADASAR